MNTELNNMLNTTSEPLLKNYTNYDGNDHRDPYRKAKNKTTHFELFNFVNILKKKHLLDILKNEKISHNTKILLYEKYEKEKKEDISNYKTNLISGCLYNDWNFCEIE
jgi:hypothetical protein